MQTGLGCWGRDHDIYDAIFVGRESTLMLKTILTNSMARRSAQILALCAVALLAACGNGGDGGNDNNNNDNIDLTLSRSVDDPGVPALTIQPGESALLHWEAGSAVSSCVASGAWSGAQSTSSGEEGFSTGVIDTAGTYTYTLTCTGSFGPISGQAVLTVAGAPLADVVDCGIGAPTMALLSGDGATASASTVTTGALGACVNCALNNVGNIVTKSPGTELTDTAAAASFTSSSALDALVSVDVIGVPDAPAVAFGPGPAGFVVAEQQTQLGAARTLTVQTLEADGTTVVEEFQTNLTTQLGLTTRPVYDPNSGGFTLQLGSVSFTATPVGTPLFVGVNATLPYTRLRLKIATGTALAAADLRIFAACVARP